LKSLSLGTDVATTVKDILDCLCNMGKTVFISSHSSKGFDFSGDTGFDRYNDNSSFVNEEDFSFFVRELAFYGEPKSHNSPYFL